MYEYNNIELTIAVTNLTIVLDPDQLMTEQIILRELNDQGFDVLKFSDHIAFRYVYESHYSRIWDNREKTHLVLVINQFTNGFNSFPFDVLNKARIHGRCLSFSIGELFPKLVPDILLQLDRSCLDAR